MLFLGTTLLEVVHLAAKVSEKFHFHHGWYYVIYEGALDVFVVHISVGPAPVEVSAVLGVS